MAQHGAIVSKAQYGLFTHERGQTRLSDRLSPFSLADGTLSSETTRDKRPNDGDLQLTGDRVRFGEFMPFDVDSCGF